MTAPLTDAEIEEARALVEAATAGPLIVLPSSNAEADDCACPVFDVRVADCLDAVTAELCVDVDAALYAAAPDLIRGLLATVDHLRAELERWHGLAQQWRTELDTVYERIDAALPEGPQWGNVLARITGAGAELERVTRDRDEARAAAERAAEAAHAEARSLLSATVDRLKQERGEARAEVSRLAAIIDAARSPVRTAAEVLDEGMAEPPTLSYVDDDGERCESCCLPMAPGEDTAEFTENCERGVIRRVVLHAGPCPTVCANLVRRSVERGAWVDYVDRICYRDAIATTEDGVRVCGRCVTEVTREMKTITWDEEASRG